MAQGLFFSFFVSLVDNSYSNIYDAAVAKVL